MKYNHSVYSQINCNLNIDTINTSLQKFLCPTLKLTNCNQKVNYFNLIRQAAKPLL